MNNQIENQKPKFSIAIQQNMYKNLINNTLGDENRAKRFIASISSAVATNPALQECEAGTILSGALLGEALNLSPSPVLGQYYLVPYNNTKRGTKDAQFQLGYKGYIQLAIRSGQYKKLNVLSIKKGELVKYDPLNEIIEVNLIEDELARESAPTIGYYAMFEYVNGFVKSLYWSIEKMEKHANQYSKAFNLADYRKFVGGQIPEKDMWKFSSFWYKDFDEMAHKTMLRQLISKWGVMSIDMQDAYVKDMAVIKEDGSYEYVDSSSETVPMMSNVSGPVIPIEKAVNPRPSKKIALDDAKQD